MIALRHGLVAFVWLAFGRAYHANADAPLLHQRAGAAELHIAASVQQEVVALALTDLLTITIEVRGDASLEVRPPDAWVQGPWLVRAAGPADRQEKGNMTVWKQALQVEPQQPGEATLHVAPIRYRDGDGTWQTATWKAVQVRVSSRLTQVDISKARDITSIEELPPLPDVKSRTGWILAGMLSATVGAALLVWWWWLRQVAASRRSPEDWVRYELSRLQALELPKSGKFERFGTLLAGLMRRYLERKLQLPARRQTTAEFMAALEGRPELMEHRDFLKTFLGRCDLLKFARAASSADECRALAEQAAQFISQLEKNSAPKGT